MGSAGCRRASTGRSCPGQRPCTRRSVGLPIEPVEAALARPRPRRGPGDFVFVPFLPGSACASSRACLGAPAARPARPSGARQTKTTPRVVEVPVADAVTRVVADAGAACSATSRRPARLSSRLGLLEPGVSRPRHGAPRHRAAPGAPLARSTRRASGAAHNPARGTRTWGGTCAAGSDGHTHGGQWQPPSSQRPYCPVRNARYSAGESTSARAHAVRQPRPRPSPPLRFNVRRAALFTLEALHIPPRVVI